MRLVLEILKMAGYFLDSPRKWERMQIGINTIHTDQKLMYTIQVPSHSRMQEVDDASHQMGKSYSTVYSMP